jgi:uncharacterized protein
MKLSKFNISIPFKGKFVYSNTFTQKFLLLDPFLMDLVHAVTTEEELSELQGIHPDLYNSMVTNGFIIDSNIDEIDRVRQVIHAVDNKDDFYHLMINPTMNCNFKCWYCYESHIKGSKVNTETLVKIKNYILNIFKEKPQINYFHLSFFGGEPLLNYKDVVLPIMAYAHETARGFEKKLFITFTTNGYLINPKMVEDFVRFGVKSLQISFDGNKENHDQTRFVSETKGSYDVIVENLKLLVRSKIMVALRVNYTEKNLKGLSDILESFSDLTAEERKRITLSMNKVWQEQNPNLFEEVDSFQIMAAEFGFDVPDPLEANTVINSCYADKRNQSVINYNGDVFKCNARDFTSKTRNGVLADGAIEWNDTFEQRMNIKLKNKPCLECRILPVCGGGCSQKAFENAGQDYCVQDFDEKKKQDLILGMFLSENTVAAEPAPV